MTQPQMLKQDMSQFFHAPKYEELSIKQILRFVKETKKLVEYFLDCEEGALLERDYLQKIISSVMPVETRELIYNASKKQGVRHDNSSELVKLTEEIFSVIRQMSMLKPDYLNSN